ncbi:retention module-containing protein, partial [Photobacterium sagamiensis]|uniref:retention module-containing protein n=1 Tax=Photobacterium sagamiensis TaxID=2910241 RepID=UPI003D0CFD53
MESYITTQSGRITAIKGSAVAEFNNARHPLTVDDVIPDGATLLFDNGTEIAIAQQDGSVLNIGNEQSVPDTSAEALFNDEIAAIQSLIASGDDPTLSLPETAAGNQTSNTGGFDFVEVERQAEETIANADYSTSAVREDGALLLDEERDEESAVIDDSVSDSDSNTQPEANNVSVTTEEDTPVSGQLTATDVDGDTLSFAKGTEPTNGSVTVNTDGTWTYTPNTDYNGSDSFTVVVSDGNGGTDTITVSVGVTPVNDGPVAVADTATVAEDGSVALDLLKNDTDLDGDKLSVKSINNVELTGEAQTIAVANGVVKVTAEGAISFEPAENFNGDINFDYVMTDGQANDSATVKVTVSSEADKAVVTPNEDGADAGAVQEDATLSTGGKLNVEDPDTGEAVFVEQTKVADGDYGTFSIDDQGNWTYELNNNHGVVQALDSNSAPVTRTITVATADGTTHEVKVT